MSISLPQHDPIQVAACACAHKFAAKLVKLGLGPPTREITGSAIIEIAGIRVVVSVTAYEGPTKLFLNEMGKRIIGEQAPPIVKLPPLHTKIISVLDTTTPRKAEWIAAKLHRACSGSLRSTLSEMIGFGLLQRGDGGYLLAKRENGQK
jgi:hypothetical protein